MTSITSPTISRPSRAPEARLSSPAGYWFAALLAVVGLVGGIAFGIDSYRGSQRHIDGFARTSVPGAMTVQIDEPTGRVVYYEGADRVRFEDLKITVTGPDGTVPVDPYVGEMIYETLDLTQGRAVATFDAAQKGAYRVAVSGVETGQLTVGDSFSRHALPGVLIGLGIVAVGVVAGLALFLATIVKRSQSRR